MRRLDGEFLRTKEARGGYVRQEGGGELRKPRRVRQTEADCRSGGR